jgi:hypothetical protein
MESASATGAEVAAGNITISSTNGAATVATTFEQITAGGNRSQSARYRIPFGYSAFLNTWDAAAISATMDMRVCGDWFADNQELSAGVYHFKDRIFLLSGVTTERSLAWQRAPSGATLKVSAIPGSAPAGNTANVGFNILLIKD